MSLSSTSFEILSDLLAIRLESFLVTSGEEAREMRQLKHCQAELVNLQRMAREMARPKAATAPEKAEPPISAAIQPPASKPKLSRRLQRLVDDLQVKENRRAASF